MTNIRVLSEQTVKHCLQQQIQACFDACAEAYRYYGREQSVLSEPSSLYLQLPASQPTKCRLKGAHSADAGAAGSRRAAGGGRRAWRFADAPAPCLAGVTYRTRATQRVC